jgi:hypothetical protein
MIIADLSDTVYITSEGRRLKLMEFVAKERICDWKAEHPIGNPHSMKGFVAELYGGESKFWLIVLFATTPWPLGLPALSL